jgi:hypothetical protein
VTSRADDIVAWTMSVGVGRYALRGVGRPQELFTLDPTEPDRADI